MLARLNSSSRLDHATGAVASRKGFGLFVTLVGRGAPWRPAELSACNTSTPFTPPHDCLAVLTRYRDYARPLDGAMAAGTTGKSDDQAAGRFASFFAIARFRRRAFVDK